jgi:hypothetical protein
MADDERSIQVDGLAFDISPRGVDAMLRGEGIEIRLSSVNVRLSESALNAILARFTPEGQPEAIQAKLSPAGVVIDRREGNRNVHLEVAVTGLRLTVADGELRVESGSS